MTIPLAATSFTSDTRLRIFRKVKAMLGNADMGGLPKGGVPSVWLEWAASGGDDGDDGEYIGGGDLPAWWHRHDAPSPLWLRVQASYGPSTARQANLYTYAGA